MNSDISPARLLKNKSFESFVFGKKDLQHLKKEESDDIRRSHEKEFLSDYFNLNTQNIFFLRQEHGDKIFRINSVDIEENKSLYFNTGDAMYTQIPGVLLCIRTADCLPVFFTAEKNGRKLAGIIHAGWRGLEMGIVKKTLLHASESCSFNPDDFSIFYGPSAGGDAYQVQEDVARLFNVKKKNADNSYMLDLRKNAMLELDKYHHVHEGFFDCTIERNNLFYSHRKGDRERNLNVIMIRK